jgi:hypothetical protein
MTPTAIITRHKTATNAPRIDRFAASDLSRALIVEVSGDKCAIQRLKIGVLVDREATIESVHRPFDEGGVVDSSGVKLSMALMLVRPA